MQIAKLGKWVLVTGLITLIAVGLAACGEKEKPTIVFSDWSWSSAQIQNAIARQIIEHGYGYPTDSFFGNTIPLMEALSSGDTHVTMEIWLPNQQAAWDVVLAEGQIEVLGKSLEDNWQSAFVIPTYVADANPGLKSVTDLPDYAHLFTSPQTGNKARLLNCPPGFACEEVNEKKVLGYDLGEYVEPFNPGSIIALDAEVLTAFQKQEPILFYYWGPTTLANRLKTEFGGYTILEEPEYTEECRASDMACAYPVAEVFIAMGNNMIDEAPEVADLLRKWDFSAGNQIAAETYMNEPGAEFEGVAVWFLRNTDEWKSWVDEAVAQRVLDGIAG
jgi:glycine betaine/proline transport system substrate-binding protein